ncbi:MAG: CPBP family intramembrane metalloprotease [Lachnospiraceae bacterium]|nr:CPBP family intramembrane metalloprotease [Lachnospiraceae bacterium]
MGKSPLNLKERYRNSRVSGVVSVVGNTFKELFSAILPLLLYYAVTIPVLLILNLLFGDGRDNGMYVIMQGIAAAAVLPFFHRMYRYDRLRRDIHVTYTRREKILRYSYAALTIGILSVAINNLFGILRIDQLSVGWKQAEAAFYGGTWVTELLFLGILIPYVEEFLYRGLIYERFRDRYPIHRSIIITSVIFGVLHFNVAQFLYAFAIGLFLASFAERYHSFFPAFLGHALANCIAVLRQEIHLSLDENRAVSLVATILFAAAGTFLYGLQFKIKRLK